MILCLTSRRAFTGVHTAEPDDVCLLERHHDGDHEWTPKPLVPEVLAIRLLLPTIPDLTAPLDPPAWVSAGYTRPEVAA